MTNVTLPEKQLPLFKLVWLLLGFSTLTVLNLSVLLLFLGLNYEYVVIFKHYLLLSPHKDWLQAGPPMLLKASEVQAVTDFSSSQNIRDRTAWHQAKILVLKHVGG